jgi:hypothetical protein
VVHAGLSQEVTCFTNSSVKLLGKGESHQLDEKPLFVWKASRV